MNVQVNGFFYNNSVHTWTTRKKTNSTPNTFKIRSKCRLVEDLPRLKIDRSLIESPNFFSVNS